MAHRIHCGADRCISRIRYNLRFFSLQFSGKVCGVQVETIEDPLMKKVRQLDKLVDELAKGKAMEKVMR